MDATVQSTTRPQSREESSRFRIAVYLQQADQIGFWWQSPRQIAKRLDVPDSSFRFHLRRREQLIRDPGLSPGLVRFLESPEGVQFLHRLLVALHLVFGLANDCGLRNIGWFLRLAGLHKLLPPRTVPSRLSPRSWKRNWSSSAGWKNNASRARCHTGRSASVRTKPFIPKSVWWRWNPSPITSCWSSTPRNAMPTLGGNASTNGWQVGRSPCVRSPATRPGR